VIKSRKYDRRGVLCSRLKISSAPQKPRRIGLSVNSFRFAPPDAH
jgi:hypothetical protein